MLQAAIKRLCRPKDDITERQAYHASPLFNLHLSIIRYTKPLSDNMFSQVEDELFNGELGELSDEEGEGGLGKKRFRWRGKRRMNATAGLRLVQKMGEKMALNEGTLLNADVKLAD